MSSKDHARRWLDTNRIDSGRRIDSLAELLDATARDALWAACKGGSCPGAICPRHGTVLTPDSDKERTRTLMTIMNRDSFRAAELQRLAMENENVPSALLLEVLKAYTELKDRVDEVHPPPTPPHDDATEKVPGSHYIDSSGRCSACGGAPHAGNCDAPMRMLSEPSRGYCTLENCGHMRQLDAIVDFLGMPRGGISVLGFLRARGEAWEDVADEWTDAIKAAFPTRSGSHDEYGVAMQMVGHRHSKDELIALVNWLLVEKVRAIASISDARQALSKVSDGLHWAKLRGYLSDGAVAVLLASLRAEVLYTKARLDGTTSAIPSLVANHKQSHRADLTRFVTAYEGMRSLFCDEHDVRFAACDRLVELFLSDKPLSGSP